MNSETKQTSNPEATPEKLAGDDESTTASGPANEVVNDRSTTTPIRSALIKGLANLACANQIVHPDLLDCLNQESEEDDDKDGRRQR